MWPVWQCREVKYFEKGTENGPKVTFVNELKTFHMQHLNPSPENVYRTVPESGTKLTQYV
jgi:hypothetical protein